MPKSKEIIDNSDSEESKNSVKNESGSEEETPKATVSKKSKAKSKDDVSSMDQSDRSNIFSIP